MTKNKKGPLFERVAELNKLIPASRVVNEQENLRPPEFDVLMLPNPEKVFPNLVVDQTLGNVSPRLRGRSVVN
jgi:hypothetical protein